MIKNENIMKITDKVLKKILDDIKNPERAVNRARLESRLAELLKNTGDRYDD